MASRSAWSVGFGGGQVAAPIAEPGPDGQDRRKGHPVGRGLRLGHCGVEERLSFAIAFGVEQCNRRGGEPRRVIWVGQRPRAGGDRPPGQVGCQVGWLVGQRGHVRGHRESQAGDRVAPGPLHKGGGAIA